MPNFEFTQYLSVNEAMEYFNHRLNSDVWFQASYQDQNSSLIESTRAIDNLNYLGVKFDINQSLEFPRWQPSPSAQSVFNAPPFTVPETLPTPIVPQEILIAVCENAIVLLDGFDFELEIRNLTSIKTEYGIIRETYDRNISVNQLRSGIASARAWTLLKPWFADTLSFQLSRVN